MSDADLLARI
jgi:Niemann-Pick C1 protein